MAYTPTTRLLRNTGYTLLEVLAVLIIAGMLAGAVAWPVKDVLTRTTQKSTIDQIRYFDHLTRAQTRRSGESLKIHIQPWERRLVRYDPQEEEEVGVPLVLPSNLEIEDVLFWPDTDSADGAIVALPCSANGHTPTYALHLTGNDLDFWLVFAGLTGQTTIVQEEEDALSLFDNLSASWNDAD